LAKLGKESFTVIKVEDSDYTDKDGITARGVKLTMKKAYDVEGVPCDKFHTTRAAVVKKFSNKQLREDINSGKDTLGPVKCIEELTGNGKKFFNLIDT
jgi:hypothetical protein